MLQASILISYYLLQILGFIVANMQDLIKDKIYVFLDFHAPPSLLLFYCTAFYYAAIIFAIKFMTIYSPFLELKSLFRESVSYHLILMQKSLICHIIFSKNCYAKMCLRDYICSEIFTGYLVAMGFLDLNIGGGG